MFSSTVLVPAYEEFLETMNIFLDSMEFTEHGGLKNFVKIDDSQSLSPVFLDPVLLLSSLINSSDSSDCLTFSKLLRLSGFTALHVGERIVKNPNGASSLSTIELIPTEIETDRQTERSFILAELSIDRNVKFSLK